MLDLSMQISIPAQVKLDLINKPKKWLITGVAGFIGSHLLMELLRLNQTVIGLDNFSTGKLETATCHLGLCLVETVS